MTERVGQGFGRVAAGDGEPQAVQHRVQVGEGAGTEAGEQRQAGGAQAPTPQVLGGAGDGRQLNAAIGCGLAAAAVQRRPEPSAVVLELEGGVAALSGEPQQLGVELRYAVGEAVAALLDGSAAGADEAALTDDRIAASISLVVGVVVSVVVGVVVGHVVLA